MSQPNLIGFFTDSDAATLPFDQFYIYYGLIGVLLPGIKSGHRFWVDFIRRFGRRGGRGTGIEAAQSIEEDHYAKRSCGSMEMASSIIVGVRSGRRPTSRIEPTRAAAGPFKKKQQKKQTNKTNRVHLQSKVSPGYSNSNEIESFILFFYSIEALEQFFFLLVVEGLERGRDQQSEGYRVFFVLNDVKMVKKRNKKKEGKVCWHGGDLLSWGDRVWASETGPFSLSLSLSLGECWRTRRPTKSKVRRSSIVHFPIRKSLNNKETLDRWTSSSSSSSSVAPP